MAAQPLGPGQCRCHWTGETGTLWLWVMTVLVHGLVGVLSKIMGSTCQKGAGWHEQVQMGSWEV